MKNLTLIILITFHCSLFTIHSYTQPCLPEGITFTTQAQIDNFQINYPGCTEIEGDVTINGSDIVNLNGLIVLTSIEGDIVIADNDALPNLTGLDNITSIGGDLIVRSNSVLTNLSGLENLDFVGENIILGSYWHMEQWFIEFGNPLLNDITSLYNLTSVTGDLYVICNTSLTGLNGLHNITSVGGNLRIAANDVLINLLPLSNLDTIQGSLEIGIKLFNLEGDPVYYLGNSCLTNLSGLNNLDYIGDCLNIVGNDTMNSLAGLANLNSIGGNLMIEHNNTLPNLSGLENLTYIGGDLEIGSYHSGNLSLESLSGLEGLTSIGGSLSIYNNPVLGNIMSLNNLDATSVTNLWITTNASLSSCEAQGICNYLSNPGGTVDIYDNAPGCNSPGEIAFECGFPMSCLPYGNYYFTIQDNIDNFPEHFPGCTELEGNVRISGNDITNLTGLSVVKSIGGILSIYSNIGLTGLSGFEDLISIGGGLIIHDNSGLLSLAGLDSLNTIGTSLIIRDNDGLTSLTGLSGLTYIGVNLKIYDNPSLTSLTGLTELNTIGGSLTIRNNNSLTDLLGLEGLNYVYDLSIEENNSLVSMTGLTGLVNIVGSFKIFNNNSLTSLMGLDSLLTIYGYLSIGGNYQLINLSGLETLQNIYGSGLTIWDNNSLTSLTGIDKVAGGNIQMVNINTNPVLSICAIESICERLAAYYTNVEIYNNAAGCNSLEEVDSLCFPVSIQELRNENRFLISPNPLESNAVIRYIKNERSHTTIKIHDLSGRAIITLVNEFQQQGEQRIEFNTSILPAGIYFCVLKTSKAIQTIKMIKL